MHHLRVLEPADGVLAFYDGRVPGHRFARGSNWVDEGAISLGIASYALVSGQSALVYDTHVSLDHARFVRRTLEYMGVRELTVVLSHWHLDHVAGTEAFGDCEVIASARTAEHLSAAREAIESGELEGPPAIDPLILPTRILDDELELDLGGTEVRLFATEIHSDDATLLWLPGRQLLFAGDAVEDTVTYVDEPERFDTHLANLESLRGLAPARILPNHGDPDVISTGGYEAGLLDDTVSYIERLLHCRVDSGLRDLSLREFAADLIEHGTLNYFEAYEDVHRGNVEKVLAAS